MRLSRREFMASSTVALAGLACGTGPPATVACEVAVVGSGFAGTFLAQRLAGLGIDTVIVEAGADPRGPQHKTGFRGYNTGGVWYPIDATRHIGIGGTSRLWTGVVCRLLPEDFRVRSTYGFGVDWPIAYEALQPYYCAAEQCLQTTGPPPVPEAEPPRDCAYPAERAGKPFGLDGTLGGVRPKFVTMALSERPDTGAPIRLDEEEMKAFSKGAQGRLLPRRQVTRVVTDSPQRAAYLETHSSFEEPLRVSAKVFVVAAGPFECARLLLVSRSEAHPEGLGNRSGHLGRHFNGHPAIMRTFESRKLGTVPQGAHRTYSLQDSMRRAGLNACAFQVLEEGDGTLEWRAIPELDAEAENQVSLTGEKRDLFGVPHVELDFNYSKRDRATLSRGREVLNAIERTYADAPFAKEERENWRSHPAGTTRMAKRAEEGVVDANNKVFGMDNLYVSGASVFPNAGTPNPTNTVVALTLRLADHIAKTHFGKNV